MYFLTRLEMARFFVVDILYLFTILFIFLRKSVFPFPPTTFDAAADLAAPLIPEYPNSLPVAVEWSAAGHVELSTFTYRGLTLMSGALL